MCICWFLIEGVIGVAKYVIKYEFKMVGLRWNGDFGEKFKVP